MQYRLLGRTGVRVSPLCLGTENFGDVTDEAESIRIVHAAIASGINLIDTADCYNNGLSEQLVGKALAGRRHRAFVVTKVHFPMGDGPNDCGNSRLHILEACEASLRRLATDHIDLYLVHRPSPEIPVDETLGALTDLVRAGKVRYVGCSTHPAWMVMEALATSDRHGFARYVSEESPYNLLDRRIENELVPLAERYGLAILAWAPLAQGVLAGRYSEVRVTGRDGAPGVQELAAFLPPGSRAARMPGTIYAERVTARGIEAGRMFASCAREFGRTPAQLALLWCKDQPGITAPIVGVRTLAHMEEALPVCEMTLLDEERAALDSINPPGSTLVNFHNSAGWMKAKV
ncbi:MAG: aldo/keto reductase [Vicinamibacterales bacterium]